MAGVGGESIGITLQLENFRLLQKYIYKKPSPGGVGSAGASRRTGPHAGRGCGSPHPERAGGPTGDTGLGWGHRTWRVAGAAHGGPGPRGTLRVLPPCPAPPRGRAIRLQEKVANPGTFPQFGGHSQSSRPGRTWGCPGHGGTDPQPPAPSSRDGQRSVRVGAQDMLLPDRLTDTGVGLAVASSARNPGSCGHGSSSAWGPQGELIPAQWCQGLPWPQSDPTALRTPPGQPPPAEPACPAHQTGRGNAVWGMSR